MFSSVDLISCAKINEINVFGYDNLAENLNYEYLFCLKSSMSLGEIMKSVTVLHVFSSFIKFELNRL